MKKVKTCIILVSLIISMIFNMCGVVKAEVSTINVYNQYYDLIDFVLNRMYTNELRSGKSNVVYHEYSLIYLDDNDVPELVERSYTDLQDLDTCEYTIYTYYKKNVIRLNSYKSGFIDYTSNALVSNVTYIPYSGLVCVNNANISNSHNIIYTLNKGRIKKSITGRTPGLFEKKGEDKLVYKWDGKVVSKNKYTKLFSKAYDVKQAIHLNSLNYVSSEEMLAELKAME